MQKEILKIAIQNGALYVPSFEKLDSYEIQESTLNFLFNIKKLGFLLEENALHAIQTLNPTQKLEIYEVLQEITGVKKNWTPLINKWKISVRVGFSDYLKTFLNQFSKNKTGVQMPCGHLIPEGAFELERYNGCPYCGTPFEFDSLKLEGKGSQLKSLILWTEQDAENYFHSLLKSKVPLDATQVWQLKTLLNYFEIPKNIEISMKETSMLVVGKYFEKDDLEAVAKLLKNPNDLMRYLWYQHTGFLQIVQPKVILKRKMRNMVYSPHSQEVLLKEYKKELHLKYSRTEARKIAFLFNQFEGNVQKICENMHPKREMWVRFIRALRFSEFAKQKGFEKLAKVLDTFYKKEYVVFEGNVQHYKLKSDAKNTFRLLKQRPGLFARSLFSNMLWFGAEETIKHFKEIADMLPIRLIFTLNMYSEYYFDKNGTRQVQPLGGVSKNVPKNKFLKLYDDKTLEGMQKAIQEMSLEIMANRFAKMPKNGETIYISNHLKFAPIPVGDRSETVQELPSALMGTRFPVHGNTVRLFMQWGEGLPAQHLDMDLSCRVIYSYKTERCSYSNLTIHGCQHSGDIQQIPNKIGTAEYIEIDVPSLQKANAEYVVFTCNAFTDGALNPNMKVGWMNSNSPMKVSNSGVAYDPSAVQHQVSITQSITKGLVFGVLDVQKKEIVWLEMPFQGQVVQQLDHTGIHALLNKLNSKLTLGGLLELKATIQNQTIVDSPEDADEVYDAIWGRDLSKVHEFLFEDVEEIIEL
ncbi:hypothetical protein [Aureivirga sp. CE67]|uniref:hypothetical protein n=1 Tax=Aureivirga sp. CE67 TaxID=1788983 RepID=UPI0018CBC457|nr:hypothetical protein [Aureivirga sp. CE67]